VEDNVDAAVMMADEPLVLTVDQVAAKLQIEPRAVIRLRNQRRLAFVKIGSQLRFRIEDVEDYLRRSLNPCRENQKYPGSEKKQTRMSGTSIGTTNPPDATNDAAAALAIAQKLKKRSANS
jgi:excisionase family DNA binding protein